MPTGSSFIRKFIGKPLDLGERNADYEKYISLISTLKGFEEYTLDREGRIISSNLEVVNITGYEEWEVIGKHISIFYSLEDQLAGKPQEDLDNAEVHSPHVLTGLRIKKRNSSFWAKIRLRTLIENGEVEGYKMTMQDATHKAVSEHRVRGIRDEYLNLFNNSFVGIFKFSMTDYSILMMNDKAHAITGLKQDGESAEGFDRIFDTPIDFSNLIATLQKQQRVEEWEVKLKHEGRWAVLSCSYFKEKDFVEGIILDTTMMKKSTLEVNRLRNELDQFIYHASHELRSPLVSMLGIINLISIEKKIETSLNLNLVLKDKVNQLDDLLKNISSIAYNNNSPFLSENVVWESLIRSILKELHPHHDPRVQIHSSVEQSHLFRNDVTRIRTILRNLITNGLKYFNPAAESSWLKISVSVNANGATLKIADNGIGIGQEYLDKIFKMFYKATPYPKGPGLGLYIVKAMTEKLEGTIRVESNVGNGTTFHLAIPNLNDYQQP